MRRLRSSALLLAAGILLGTGCVVPAMPPPLSVARFARMPHPVGADRSGRVSATAGVFTAGHDRIGQDGIAGVDGEGALSLWLGRGYDLTLVSTGYMSEVEGNLRLTRGPMEVGILHGVGLAVAVAGGGPTVFAEANAGLMCQLNLGGGVLVLAGRGSYDTVWVSPGVNAAADSLGNPVQPYASVALSAAWSHPVGGLALSPELTVMRRLPVVTRGGRPEWVAALMIGVSAPFPGRAGR